jgi:hypothetical protein
MSRRAWITDIGLLGAGLALLLGWHEFFPWFLHVTGTTNESGRWYAFWSGFGSDIGEITIAGAVIDMARRGIQHHRELLAQNARHHREKLEQDKAHHEAHLSLLGRQHQQRLDQADVQHEALKAHITATLAVPVPRAAADAAAGTSTSPRRSPRVKGM